MKPRSSLFILLILVVSVSLPAHAYADPTGGTLFQVLMPMLAAIWGAWMIFAHRIRRWMGNVLRKWRGIESEDPVR